MAVKPGRRYDSRLRRAQASKTREAIVNAAERLFLRDGFAATTIAAIAKAAGVSAETIYKAFGGKPGMVRAICERGLQGEGPVPAETRSDELQRREPDPRAIIRGWGELTAEVAPRIAPILLLLRAAAAEPEMGLLQADIEARRLARMTRNAQALVGHLRAGITVEQAADVLWTCSSPELYELLILKRGWPPEQYGNFVADAIAGALLPPDQRAHAAQADPATSPDRGNSEPPQP